jgi:hypothetical protein
MTDAIWPYPPELQSNASCTPPPTPTTTTYIPRHFPGKTWVQSKAKWGNYWKQKSSWWQWEHVCSCIKDSALCSLHSCTQQTLLCAEQTTGCQFTTSFQGSEKVAEHTEQAVQATTFFPAWTNLDNLRQGCSGERDDNRVLLTGQWCTGYSASLGRSILGPNSKLSTESRFRSPTKQGVDWDKLGGQHWQHTPVKS